MMRDSRRKSIRSVRGSDDWVMIGLTALLIVFGIALLASASSNMSESLVGDAFHYVKRQLMYGVGLGLLGFLIASRIRYQNWQRFAVPLLMLGLGLLMLTFTPLAFTAKGASRWVAIGPFVFQPSEPLKLCFMAYLAAWLAGTKMGSRHTRAGFAAFLAIIGTIMGILVAQPATSTAVIIGTMAGIMYFASGAKWSHIGFTIAAASACIALLIYATPGSAPAGTDPSSKPKNYRLLRIEAFLHPEETVKGGGFQANQAKIAIGAGGLLGVGYGQSTTKLNYLPEPLGDSIFAVAGEELGFVGCMALLMLFALLVGRIFIAASRTREPFGHLFLVGTGSLIALQSFVNIGAISGVMPSTGIPLPFISYGSTGLAVFMTMIGIANNIVKQNDA